MTTRNSSHISFFRDQCIAKYFWNDVEVQNWIYDIQLSLYLSTDVISCVLDSTFVLNRSEMSVSFLVVNERWAIFDLVALLFPLASMSFNKANARRAANQNPLENAKASGSSAGRKAIRLSSQRIRPTQRRRSRNRPKHRPSSRRKRQRPYIAGLVALQAYLGQSCIFALLRFLGFKGESSRDLEIILQKVRRKKG